MDYFIIHQDERVTDVVKLIPGSLNLRTLTREQLQDISTTIIRRVKENSRNQYPDYLEEEGMLISEKLKKIMSKYQSNAVFKTIVLIEKNIHRQEIYYILSPPQIECTSSRAVYDKQGYMKEFVLDEEKVGHARIFCAEGYGNRIFVRLDVAESILRRMPYGVAFEKVTVETS